MIRTFLLVAFLAWMSPGTSCSTMSKPNQPNGQGSGHRQPVSHRNTMEELQDMAEELFNDAEELFNDAKEKTKEIIRPAKRMFDGNKDVMRRFSQKMSVIYNRIRNPKLRGSPVIDLKKLTENDAVRLLREITRLPAKLQRKLTEQFTPENLTISDLKLLPTDIFQAATNETIETLKFLPTDKKDLLCRKLMEPHSHPANLRRALKEGFNCTRLLSRKNKNAMRRRARSQSAVMMEHVRKETPPTSWSSRRLSQVVRQLGDALSVEDINDIPIATIRKSLSTISKSDIPRKSVRQGLVKKLMAEYSSPAMWPDNYLASMGRLLEDVNVQQLTLLIHRAVINVAPELTEAGLQKETTRLALRRTMARALKAAPSVDKIAQILPWMKEDVTFMRDLNLTNFLEALPTVNVTFTAPETNMIAERLEKELMSFSEADDKNKTDYVVDVISRFADGFDMEYLETLADETVPKICVKMKRPASRPKSKILLRKLRASNTLSVVEMAPVFSGMNLEDVEDIPEDELLDALPTLKHQNLPQYLARKIVNKVVHEVFAKNSTSCHDGFHRLGNLARYVNPDIIDHLNVIPISMGEEDCENDFDDISLRKPQIMALVDNIRGMLKGQNKTEDGDSAVFSSLILEKLGKLVTGVTADDIQALPIDTDLLSAIEVLAFYEDDLDFSQIKVIAEKIRDYFDIKNRNVLSDVDDIVVLQIGKFLQYLNSDFELTKFPKRLRPLISQEMGKSSLLKIPKGKRQALLKFALKNTNVAGEPELQDVTRLPEINEDDLMDLGSLKCGLSEDDIGKLTSAAIDVHIEELQACPWRDQEAKALTRKALAYNINLLSYREQMATMGSLLPYLEQNDMDKLSNSELAEVMGYISQSAEAVEMKRKEVEKNGFIRERSSEEQRNHDNKRIRLMKTGFQTMKDVFGRPGTGKCHMVMRLKGAGNDIEDLLEMPELQRCLDFIGAETWEPNTARALLKKVLTLKNWGELNKETVEEYSEFFLEVMPSLLVGLSADEIASLNLTTPESIASLAEIDGFNEEKLESGFNTWLSKRRDSQNVSISREDIDNLQEFTCGASASYVKDNIHPDTVREGVDVLRRCVRKCNRDKLNEYARKLTSSLGNNAQSWKLRDVVGMGSLIGGLTKRQLSSLTRSQIKVIEPDVITHMPPDKVQELTVEQLGEFTSNQVSAITTMQQSYMSEQQMDALGLMNEIISGGVPTVPFDITMITVILATFRQILVFFVF